MAMKRLSISPGVRERLGQHRPELAALAVTVILMIVLVSTGVLSTEESGDTNNLILALVGAGAFPFAVWRSRFGERQADGTAKQAKHAEEQAESAARQAEQARLTRLNDQFTAAAQMVGDDAAAVRRLGIHSFQALATDHPAEYYVRVLRSLCDYAREPYLRADGGPKVIDPSGRLRSDVQAAVQAIGKVWQLEDKRAIGVEAEPSYVPNLIDADLRAGRFWSLSLEGAQLKRAKCTCAVFANVHLNGVHFTRACLSGADFSGRRIDDEDSLRPSSLAGADLTGANCAGADFTDVSLKGANLSGTRFEAETQGDIEFGPACGLTQAQLNQAYADPDRPPRLDGVCDADTGKPLDASRIVGQ